MFCHFERTKCEWLGGNLWRFVEHFNTVTGTHYRHDRCLDAHRKGGEPECEPEVRVIGDPNEQPMVIERKTLAPEFYFQHHDHEHAFVKKLNEGLPTRFRNGAYELIVSGPEFDSLNKKQVLAAAQQIAIDISRQTEATSHTGNQPFAWRVERSHENTRPGIALVLEGPSDAFISDFERDYQYVRKELIRYTESIERKMSKYIDHRKLLLLEIYDLPLSESEAVEMVCSIERPAWIDEIWLAVPNWISDGEYETAYLKAAGTIPAIKLNCPRKVTADL